MIFKTVCRIFLKNKWVSRYLSFGILWFRKIALHNEIINKTRSTKNQENSVHSFGDNYLTNHLVKFGLYPEKLELLEYALVITFVSKNH